MVHEPNRNKESPSLLRIESLPISAFIRGRFGLKRPIKFTEQGVHWLLAASRFQPGKNAGSLAVGPPRLAGTRGQHMRWWARPQQLGQGAISDPAAQFGGSSRPLLSALHTPLPGCHPSAPLGPSCKAKCGLGGILRPTGRALPQTKAWPLPGPIKPPAFPAFQPSLSLGSPISSGARVPAAPVPHGLNPSGPATRALGWQIRQQRSVCELWYRGAAEAC